jgi:hypothetical protein
LQNGQAAWHFVPGSGVWTFQRAKKPTARPGELGLLSVERGCPGRKGLPRRGLVPEGRSDRSLARSAWDSATSKEPSRRVRSDSRRYAHRFDDWSDWPSKKNGAPFDEIPLGLNLRPIIPCPTGRFFRGGAVPGTSCQATIGPSLRDSAPCFGH